MRLKGATTILKKQAEFLGMTFNELITFIERSPLAMKNSTIEAHKVWKREKDWATNNNVKKVP